MRLPGTRYQEHGWEHVRKLLGQCSLRAFAHRAPDVLLDPVRAGEALPLYVDLVAEALRGGAVKTRFDTPGNSYGESVLELAFSLACELQAHPSHWTAFGAAVAAEHARLGRFWENSGGDAILRKKVNDMYAGLRDKVDADNYQAACGRPCSPNKIYAYRMLDTAYGDIARLFDAWQEHSAQVAAILGREVQAMPIEVRQLRSIGDCKAEWILRWSESREQFGDGPGPLHTRSKRFANLKTSPGKIQAMLGEIGDYEELSSNRDRDWLFDAGQAGEWLDDLQRVMAESERAASMEPDQILAAPGDDADEPGKAPLSPPPRLGQADRGSWTAGMLAGDSLPVRLAVYLKMLGGADDSYPVDWLDPVTGELPTMQQLATLDQVSLPTLRKRRDAAIERLLAAAAP